MSKGSSLVNPLAWTELMGTDGPFMSAGSNAITLPHFSLRGRLF